MKLRILALLSLMLAASGLSGCIHLPDIEPSVSIGSSGSHNYSDRYDPGWRSW